MPITNFLNLADVYKNEDAMKEAAQQRSLRELNINQARDEIGARDTLRSLYRANTRQQDGRTDIGFDNISAGMAEAGYGEHAPSILSAGHGVRKTSRQEGTEVAEMVGRIFSGVKPGDPQSAAAAKQNALQFGIPKSVIDQMPDTFTSQDINRLRQASMSPKEWLAAQKLNQGTQPATQEDRNAPWAHINDPKKRDDAKIRFGAAADARLAKAQEEQGKSEAMINDLDRFVFLNERSTTGPGFNVPGSQKAASFNDDYAEMIAIQDKMTPQMRQGMPGAASDRDVAMFRGATVGLSKGKEANINIATGLKLAHQNTVDRTKFLNEYVTARGHDRGADVEWKKYLNANPIFDPKAKRGSYELNTNRLSYDEWVGKSDTGNTGGIQFLGFE